MYVLQYSWSEVICNFAYLCFSPSPHCVDISKLVGCVVVLNHWHSVCWNKTIKFIYSFIFLSYKIYTMYVRKVFVHNVVG